MGYDAHFQVWRGDDTGGGLEDYTVEVNEGEVVLDIVHRLAATQAPDLAVRWNCKAGKCGSCSAEVNGRPRLMCMTRMSIFEESEVISVTPLRAFPVIKDLVTDVSFNYKKAREIPAFAPPDVPLGDYRMAQMDVERSQEFRKCIECFLCQDTCHVIRDHEENKESFAGPRFFIRLAELDMHPLDTLDRKREAQETHGLGQCNITKCCTEVCPEHIHITDNAIIPMKERVVDTMYDPLMWLGNKIGRRPGSKSSRSSRGKPAGDDDPGGAGHGQFAQASETSRARVHSAGRGKGERRDALRDHAWVLLCAVEADQLPLARVDDEITSSLQEAQRLASTSPILAGDHALHHLVRGEHGAAVEQAREAIKWDRDQRTRSDDLLTLSAALDGLGEHAEAGDALAESRSLWPANPRLPRA